jgi:hypothetical protein
MLYLPDGCIQWTGARTVSSSGKDKYAIFDCDGKTRVLHRYLYVCLVDENIEDKTHLDHTCKHMWCVNYIEHLEPVTCRENVVVRGVGITAMQALKTHCPRGHEYSGINANGSRICRICQRIQLQNSRRRRKGLPEEWPDWWNKTSTRDPVSGAWE